VALNPARSWSVSPGDDGFIAKESNMAFPELGNSDMKQEAVEKGTQEIGETKAEHQEAPEVTKRVEQATFDP
jgi:iron-sulfur cluster repair protein YtfE (RIC family)